MHIHRHEVWLVGLQYTQDAQMDGWKTRFYVFFNSISDISGRSAVDNERLSAMAPRLLMKRSPPQVGLIPGTARSAGQRLTNWAIGAAICAKNEIS